MGRNILKYEDFLKEGYLTKITKEYFGDNMRKEDMVVSDFLKKCIESGKKERFASMFKGWGDKGKEYLVFENEGTPFSEAELAGPYKVHRLLHDMMDRHKYSYRCLSKDIFLSTPETYGNMIDGFGKLPEGVRNAFHRLFGLYCNHPVYLSSWMIMYQNRFTLDFNNVFPGEAGWRDLEDFQFLIQDSERYGKDGKCLFFSYPDGNCGIFTDPEFRKESVKLVKELMVEAERNGFGILPMANIFPYQEVVPEYTDFVILVDKSTTKPVDDIINKEGDEVF